MSMLRRVLDREALVKSSLIESLRECVKELQLRDAGERGQPLTNDEITNTLCWVLEALFIHGLKNPFLKSVSSALASRTTSEPQLPEPSFWEFILIFCHHEVIIQINKFSHIRTDIGRCRSWLRLAINDGLLISYLQLILSDKNTVKDYYKPNAFLRDAEKCDILKSYLYGIESYEFQLACNSSLLNTWNVQPLSMVGLWVQTDYSVSQGIDVAENMDSKDLQAIPQLRKATPPKPSFFTSFESRVPLLEEDEALRVILSTASRGSATSSSSSRKNSDASLSNVSAYPATSTTLAHTSSSRSTSSQSGGKKVHSAQRSRKTSREEGFVKNSIATTSIQENVDKIDSNHTSSNFLKNLPPIASTVTLTPDTRVAAQIVTSTPAPTAKMTAATNSQLKEQRSSSTLPGNICTSKPSSDGTAPITIRQNSTTSTVTSTEEDSYAALFHSYNRDSVIGTPITVGSFIGSQFSSGYGGGNPFGNETSTSSELEPALGSSIEENHGLSQIEMYSQRIPSEMGLDIQNYRCRNCERQIGMIYGPARICGLTGFYYCPECHCNDESVIPARILLNWDFTRYHVCKLSKEFLDEVVDQPLFNLKEINEKLYREVEECAELSAIRTKLNSVSIYLRTCKEPIMSQFKKEIWPKDYLYEDIHTYALSDLLNIPNRNLRGSLTKLLSLGKEHIASCSVCQLKGFVCEVCKNRQVIFPFELERIYKCSACGAVYHNSCMNNMKPCPRCERWKISAYDADLSSL